MGASLRNGSSHWGNTVNSYNKNHTMFEKLIKLLAELVAAINANTAALQANAGSAPVEEEGQAADADAAGESEGEPEGEGEPEAEPPPPAKAKGKAPVKPAAPAVITLNDLRAVASELLGQGKTAELKAVLAKYKAPSLTKLDEKHYAAVLAALKKL